MRKNAQDAMFRFRGRQPSPSSVQGGSIWTDGDTIWSYGTALVTFNPQQTETLLNVTEYSKTTTIHQNALRAFFVTAIPVDDIPRGSGSRRTLVSRGSEAYGKRQIS